MWVRLGCVCVCAVVGVVVSVDAESVLAANLGLDLEIRNFVGGWVLTVVFVVILSGVGGGLGVRGGGWDGGGRPGGWWGCS